MDEELHIVKRKPKIDTGLLIGLVAILINVITVSVYMYQAQIMQSQQHASAWPYLEWLTSFNEEQCYIEIANNGIGPAIITDVQVKLGGKPMVNMDAFSRTSSAPLNSHILPQPCKTASYPLASRSKFFRSIMKCGRGRYSWRCKKINSNWRYAMNRFTETLGLVRAPP